jgi:O-Methyltransferase involved in polyketide biosynthesis
MYKNGKIVMNKLQGVADTLYIPLEARIFVSKRFPEYFYDEKAISLEGYMPDDNIRKKSSEYSLMASVARYYNMDAIAKSFIGQYGRCAIVYLGAGLETAYYRIGKKNILFYEVDLPDVIDTRRKVLGEHANEILIGGDMFDMAWAKSIDKDLPSLLVVSGVFQYFDEDKVIKFVRDVQSIFNKTELLFDAVSKIGIKYANKYVQKTGNTNALMHFYVDDSVEFALKTGTTLIEERVFFTDARKILANKLGIYTRIAMKIVDCKKRAIIIRIKCN